MNSPAAQYTGDRHFSGGATIVNSISPPSLEMRLDYLNRAGDRLAKVRSHAESIADRFVLPPPSEPGNGMANSPQPCQSNLVARFGDALAYTHNTIDEIERYLSRIEGALFSGSATKGIG